MSPADRNRILRLSEYKSALFWLKKSGFVKVFSENLADATGETAARVRKDFSRLGIRGSKRGGYTVDDLINKINEILGVGNVDIVVAVSTSTGCVGLLDYDKLWEESTSIAACFCTDAVKQTEHCGMVVQPMSAFRNFVQANAIQLGILAVPEAQARAVYQEMVDAGIRGVLNMSPVRLRPKAGTMVTNVNLQTELENLRYFLARTD